MVKEPTEATQTTRSRLLSELRHGSRYALLPLVYHALRILAHRRGIVHRDIKPSSIMIRTGGMVKILDFGIAKLRAADRTQGTAIGTLVYMNAEQLRGETTDARTDLWLLGMVLYENLTGRRPLDDGYALTARSYGHLRGGLVPRYWIPAERRWPGHRWRSHRLTLTRRAR